MSAGSPPPWEAKPFDPISQHVEVVDWEGNTIALVVPLEEADADSIAEAIADGHLIAAAADLLAALKAILPWHDAHPSVVARCRAAIAKARGDR